MQPNISYLPALRFHWIIRDVVNINRTDTCEAFGTKFGPKIFAITIICSCHSPPYRVDVKIKCQYIQSIQCLTHSKSYYLLPSLLNRPEVDTFISTLWPSLSHHHTNLESCNFLQLVILSFPFCTISTACDLVTSPSRPFCPQSKVVYHKFQEEQELVHAFSSPVKCLAHCKVLGKYM